jgi:hypothetical protein
VHQHRPVERLAEQRLLVSTEVVTPRDGAAGAAHDLERLVVGDAGEGRHRLLELRDVALHGR